MNYSRIVRLKTLELLENLNLPTVYEYKQKQQK